jgi:transposase
MFVEKVINNGSEYLRLVESCRYVNSKGVKTSKKNVIYNIGPLKRFDDGKPNFVERLKESFKNGTPIIPELYKFLDYKPVREKYDIGLSEGDPDCIGTVKLYSHSLIERILEEIGLIGLFNRYKALTNYEFDLTGFFRLLVYGRILNPASKIATVSQNNDYYNEIVKEPYEYNVYDTLDFINQYENSIINKINKNLTEKFKRTTDIIYYDVTNFFFEIGQPDADVTLDDETVSKGVRKFGVSKEERHLPIVQMGLFMDEQGLPISIETFPGNTLDHLTMIDALSNTVDKLNLSRFIFVGDRGMCSGTNMVHLLKRNHGYIISKSIEKTNAEERKWIYDQTDYIKETNDFKYKSRIVKRTIKLKDTDENYDITQKVVVYWSKKFYDKQYAENKSFLEFIDKLEKNPESFRITKMQSNNLKKFLKDDIINNKTGEVLNSKDIKLIIDYDKINKFKEQMGYYQIVSSELNLSEKEIIDTYHGLSRIEDQFRTMKGSLETRPVFVRTPEHIKAHLLICMIALTVVRIIQTKIVSYQNKDKSKKHNWELGLNSDRIQAALNKWTVSYLTNGYYRFNDINNKDLKLILDAFNIKIPIKLYKPMELKNLKTNIEIST